MNKFLTKIIGASLAIAMMIGGAVGINAAKEAKEVNAATVSGTFNKYSGILTEGDYVVAHGTSKAMMNTTANTRINATSISVENNAITNPNESIVWHISASGNYWTLYNAAVSKYAASTGVKNKGQLLASGTDDMSLWSCSSNGNSTTYDFVNKKNTANSVNATLRYNSSNADNSGPFAAYSTSTGTALTLYKKDTSGGQSLTALADPNPQYNDSTKKVTWTTDAHATKYQIKVDTAEFEDISITPNPEYDASGLTTGVQHTVQIKAVGDETNYSSTTGSIQFTPTVPFVSRNFALCTSVKDLEAGASYLITNGITGSVKTMSTESNSDNRKSVEVTVSNSLIATTENVLTLTLGGTSDVWTFHTENYLGTDGYFAPSTGDNNKLRIVESGDTCTISFNNNKNAIITFSSNAYDRNILRNNGSIFSCYASGQSPVYLWKAYKPISQLNVTGAPTKLSYYQSQTFDPTGITAVEVVYSDNSTKPISLSDIKWPSLTAQTTTIKGSYTELIDTVYTPTYNVTILEDELSHLVLAGNMTSHYYTSDNWDKGNITVTAVYLSGQQNSVSENITFKYYRDSAMTNEVATPAALGAGENQTIYVKATYQGVSNTTGYAQTVTVEVEHGSESNDPLTADEAITIGQALASSGTTTKYYYIQGMVASITTNQLNQSGENQYATFTYDDNNGSASFKAYKIKPNAGCTDFTDFKVGAVVLIRCKIYKYASSVIENDETGEILSISFTAAPLQQIDVDKDNLELGKGDTYTLKATANPLNAEMDDLIWRSDDTSVATVGSNGIVRGVGEGETRVYAISHGIGSTVCRVKVYLTASLNLAINSTKTTSHESMQWEVPNKFEMELAKGESQNHADDHYPDAAHNYTETRFYNNQVLTFTGDSTLNIRKVELRAKESSDIQGLTQSESLTNVTVSNDYLDVILRPVDGTSPFSILVKKACNFTSVKVYYNCSTNFEDYKAKSSSFSVISGNEDAEHNPSNIKLNFGVRIRQCDWSSMNSGLGEITDYGVMFVKKSTLSGYPKHTIAESFGQHSVLAVVNKGSGATPLADGNDYVFSAYINITTTDHYGIVYVAAPFIVAGGNYYFFNEMEHSVRSMAEACFDQGVSNLSDEALLNLI